MQTIVMGAGRQGKIKRGAYSNEHLQMKAEVLGQVVNLLLKQGAVATDTHQRYCLIFELID